MWNPGICMNPGCLYTAEVEPDQRQGWCEVCGTTTVRSGIVLAGLILTSSSATPSRFQTKGCSFMKEHRPKRRGLCDMAPTPEHLAAIRRTVNTTAGKFGQRLSPESIEDLVQEVLLGLRKSKAKRQGELTTLRPKASHDIFHTIARVT
jgi:hypothetical protein